MKSVVLISCVSKKLSHAAPASQLYRSALFRGNLHYASALQPDAIYILSAKHGLVTQDQIIEPYNLTLNTMRDGEIMAWAERVLAQLRQVADLQEDRFVFLAGQKYRKHLIPHILHCEVPMAGLSIGKQLQFLAGEHDHE